MKISIITVTYNSAETIEQTILSVINQSYKNIEYIIIDGKSTDATLSIIEKYKNQISKIVSEKDHGLYDALNKGIAIANGDVIGILHSDDFYTHTNVLQLYADAFTKNSFDAIYSDLYYVDKTNTGYHTPPPNYSNSILNQSHPNVNLNATNAPPAHAAYAYLIGTPNANIVHTGMQQVIFFINLLV